MKTKVIIVHQYERTLSLSKRIAEKQVGIENIVLVSEKPFAKSLRKSFEIALSKGCEWMILIGGDQLIFQDAVKILVEKIEDSGKNTFRISGYGWDHLLMRKRLMAPSIYRVSLLNKALEIDFDSQIQPESYVLQEMIRVGYSKVILNECFAVHDSGQYYRDIYRKGYFEAQKIERYIKNQGILGDLALSNDIDHKVFLTGIEHYQLGMKMQNPEEVLNLLNLKEKE